MLYGFRFFAVNITIMLAISLLYGILIEKKQKDTFLSKLLHGLFLGFAAVMVMVNSYKFDSGVIFDCRTVVLGVAGMFCGPIAATFAVLITAFYRFLIGGSGLLMGISTSAGAALIGVWFYYLKKKRPYLARPIYLYLFGLLIHIVMLLLVLTLPKNHIITVYEHIALPVLVLFPLAVVLLGKLLIEQEDRVAINQRLTSEIKEHNKAEKELMFQSTILDQIGDLITATDLDGKIIYVNQAECDRFGKTRDELIGKYVGKYANENPEDNGSQRKIINETLKRGIWVGEITNYDKDGNPFPVECRTFLINGEDGKPAAMVGLAADISRRKRREQQLLETTRRFEVVSEKSGSVVWEVDTDGLFTYASNSCESVWGYKPQEIVGKMHFYDFHPEEGKEEFRKKYHKTAVNKESFIDLHSIITTKSGKQIWVTTNGTPVLDKEGNLTGYFGVDTDITEEKRAKEAAENQANRLNAILRAIPNMLFIMDYDGNCTEFYSAKRDKLLTPADKIIGSNLKDVFGEEKAKQHIQQIRHCIDTASLVCYEYDAQIDNNCQWFEARLVKFNTNNVLAMITDITERKIAEQDVVESEEKYRNLVEVSMDAIFINQNYRITYVNDAAIKLFGGNCAEDIIGKSPLELFHPDYHSLVKQRISDMLNKSIAATQIEEKIIRLDGEIRDVEVAAACFTYKGEKAILVAVKDITEHKQSHQHNELLAKILTSLNKEENLRIAIENIVSLIKEFTGFDAVGIRFEQNGDFPYYSQQGFSEDFLLTENSLLARDEIGKVCRDENGDFCLECTCGLVLSGKFDPNDPLFTPYGSFWTNNSLPLLHLTIDQDPRLNPRNNCIHQHYKSVALIPIRAGKQIVGLLQLNSHHKDRLSLSMVKFFENICDSIGTALVRKQTQLELRLANKSLRKATSRASLLKSKAEAANKAKGQFLANMSHELRTPLNSILGFSELLANEHLDTDAESFVDIIRKQGNMLLSLVNDILDFTVIEAGKLRIDIGDIELSDFVKHIETIFKSLAESKGLDFEVVCGKNLPKAIKTDYERLNQCINNLIINAIKFTDAGKVSVKISNLEEKNLIRIDVEDSGIGIPEDKQKDVFEAFMQADISHTRKYGGIGLGLPIVKHIIGLLGGELSFVSKEGCGTTFTILIPHNPKGLEKPEQQQQTYTPDKKLRGKVLVVEDSPVNLKLLVLMLEKIGFDVETACDGIEALEKIDADYFDLIYMDIQMPRMNGYEATMEIKRQGITTPVIAVTAAAMEDDRIKCEQAGCDYYITKPVNKQKLYEIAAKFLHN